MKTSIRTAVALSAGALALAVLAPAAQAITARPAAPGGHVPPAGPAGWRVNTVISFPGKVVEMISVDAVSATDAWAAGTAYGKVARPLLEHWDGKSWRQVTLPADAIRHFSRRDIFANIGALSRTDVWAVSFRGHYARLHGTRWTFGALPGSAGGKLVIDSVKALGPADVWAFGNTSTGTGPALEFAPYAARFDGRRWTRISVPARGILGQVSAISGRDIWAVTGEQPPLAGTPAKPRLLRWNGSRWRPAAHQPALPKGASISAILAMNDSNVWIGGSVRNGKSGTSELAMHWNGTAWITASPKTPATNQEYGIASFTPDPAGGFWAISANLNDLSQRIWHNARGRWSPPQPAPWLLFQLAAVPNTTSTWGVAWNAEFTKGLIVLHGPRPR